MSLLAPAAPALPPLLRRYLDRAVPGGTHAVAAVPRRVRLHQLGELRLAPGAQPLRFRAVQELDVAEPGFRWRATVPLAPLLPLPRLTVRDSLEAGRGSLVARAAGLVPVARAGGADVALGQALRYLAELPWVPHALAANPHHAWQQLDDGVLEVSLPVAGGERAAVELRFDELGDITEVACAARPRLVDGAAVPTPWGGAFCDYAVLGGLRLPTRGRVWWELPEGRFGYWSATVVAAEPVA